MTTNEDVDARFVAADRAAALPKHQSALADLFAAVKAPSLRQKRRRAFAGAGIAGALVVGLLVGAPTATAAIRDFLAQSGTYCSGTECGNDPTQEDAEWIDSGASDFAQYVDSLYPSELPLADGMTRESVVGQLVGTIQAQNAADARDGYPAGYWASLGLSSSLEYTIYCGWVDQWIAADRQGDAASADRAARVMREATQWPAIVKTGGGGVVDIMISYADAADRDDSATVSAGAAGLGCVPLANEAP